MSQQRYHIHVCLVKNEQPDLENALQVAMADSYFLTWDLFGSPTNFMEYTRQQIDQCDYVLFVLGDSYGNLSPSGVSFLHLSYVYATTKRKTLFALMKQADKVSFDNETHTRQRNDFASMLEKDQAEYTTFYANNLTFAINSCLFNLSHLIDVMPQMGWVKSHKNYTKQPERLFTPNTAMSNSKSIPTTLRSEKLSQQTTQKPTQRHTPVVVPTIIPATSEPHSLENVVKPAEAEKGNLALEDSISIRYTAHAYKDGNLSDLELQHELSWLDIVVSLRKMKEPFTSDMLQRNLNTLLSGFALGAAKTVQPQTHAVARTQINTADFDWIKKQLIANHWLSPVTNQGAGVARNLWQLGDDLK